MSKKATTIVLVASIIIYTLLLIALSIAHYEPFKTAIFDPGIMAQVTWNTALGRWPATSIDRPRLSPLRFDL
jgi:uncharacterized membrane protein